MVTVHGYLWEWADRLLREGLGLAPGARTTPTLREAWCCTSLILFVPATVALVGSLPYSLFPSTCSHPSSEEWQKVSKSEREKMGVTVQDDGEFW